MFASWKKSYDTPRQCIKKQRHHFADKGLSSQSYSFSSSHVWMWGLKHKVGWALKNWYFHTVVMERLLRTTWTSRRSNQSILKEINSDYSLEGLMLKLKLQYFDHQMWKSNSGKDPDAEKDWGQDEKGTTEGEMIGWHHWLNGYEFEQIPGHSKEQGNLVCCSPWDCKESDTN